MSENPIEAAAAELESLRTEIADLNALEEPTEEQAARFAAALAEWDVKKPVHDELVARAEKVEEIKRAALDPKNVESGFGAGVNVSIKRDPFENLDGLRFEDPNSDDMIARAHTALEESSVRGVSDSEIEEAIRKVESVSGAAVHALRHGSPAYLSAFREYLRSGGMPVYSAEQAAAVRASVAIGTGSTGGFALPTLLDPTLIHTGAATRNPLRQVSRVVTGTQNVWHGVGVGNVTTYWKAEGSAFTDGSPTFTGPSVTAAALTAYVTASYEVFQDSNLQAQLPGLIAESLDYAEGTAFISGSGSGAPKGIVTAISATAASTVTATTRGSFTSASVADVFAVVNAVAPRYEDNATWVANKQTFNTIRQMSTGSYGSLFWSDFSSQSAERLLGSPKLAASDMATTTTSGTVLAILGDFSQFVIYDRIGVQVEFIQNVVDGSGLPTGQRGLVAVKRVGSDTTDLGAFRFLKT